MVGKFESWGAMVKERLATASYIRRSVARIFVTALMAGCLVSISVSGTAHADASSGWTYMNTTGEYYPGWYADNCIDSVIVSSNGSNQSLSSSQVDPDSCGSTKADMGASWIGVDAEGFNNAFYLLLIMPTQLKKGGSS
jgi:hypothetical protein